MVCFSAFVFLQGDSGGGLEFIMHDLCFPNAANNVVESLKSFRSCHLVKLCRKSILSQYFASTGLTDGFLELIQCWWEVTPINCGILWYLVQNSWVNSGGSFKEIGKVFSLPVSDAAFPSEKLCHQMKGGGSIRLQRSIHCFNSTEELLRIVCVCIVLGIFCLASSTCYLASFIVLSMPCSVGAWSGPFWGGAHIILPFCECLALVA